MSFLNFFFCRQPMNNLGVMALEHAEQLEEKIPKAQEVDKVAAAAAAAEASSSLESALKWFRLASEVNGHKYVSIFFRPFPSYQM